MKNELSNIFNKYDPVGLIGMGAPTDEYSPEVELVFQDIMSFESIEGGRKVLLNILESMFGEEILSQISEKDLEGMTLEISAITKAYLHQE